MSTMSELTLTIIKLGFLAVLWLFVLTAVSVMRSDLFGRRSRSGRPGAAAPVPRAAGRTVAPPQPKPPKGRRGVPSLLVVTQGALSGTTVRLGDQPVSLGRSQDSTIVLDDDYVSSRHARFFPGASGSPGEGQWMVEDLGSTNGTYLGKSRLSAPMAIPPGTPVRIGKTVLELRK